MPTADDKRRELRRIYELARGSEAFACACFVASSKYFFFDVGVVSALQGRRFRPGTPDFGEALETYLMHELTSYSDYVSQESLSYWRSTTGFEVDFIVEDHTAVEVKAKENVSAQDLKSLRALAEEKQVKRYLLR